MKYEYLLMLWMIFVVKMIIDYKKNKYSDYVYKKFKKIVYLEIVPLLGMWLMFNNMLPILFMRRKNFWNLFLVLFFLFGTIECYKMRIIKKVGDSYKKRGELDKMPSMEKWMYKWGLRSTDEYAWIVATIACFFSILLLIYRLVIGDYGEVVRY